MLHINRNATIFGKTAILNYIGYAKLWHKGSALLLPDILCKRNNGRMVNIRHEFDLYTQGFLWGFCNNDSDLQKNYARPKTPLISKNTLLLDKEMGGTQLIDYQKKLKAFRILLVYKYFDSNNNQWKGILRFWFCPLLRPINQEFWDNRFPHSSDLQEVPPFFKQCIIDFKSYFNKHGTTINEKISSKKIYQNIIMEDNHIPSSIIKFPELIINGYLKKS